MPSEAALRKDNDRIASTRDGEPVASSKVRLLTLEDLDKRTRASRDAYQLRDQIYADLGGGDGLSALQRGLVDTVAVMTAMIRHLETQWLTREGEIDLAVYSALVNTRRREALTIGLRRVPRDVTPTLDDVKGFFNEQDRHAHDPD